MLRLLKRCALKVRLCDFLSEIVQLLRSISCESLPLKHTEPVERRCVRDESRSAARNRHRRAKSTRTTPYNHYLPLAGVKQEECRRIKKLDQDRRLMKVLISVAACCDYAVFQVRSAVTVTGQQKHQSISIFLNECQFAELVLPSH